MNADQFGAAVSAAMGAPAEFAQWPMLRATLHLASSWAWQDLLDGEYGTPSPQTFAVRACECVEELIARIDRLSGIGWSSRRLKTTFAEIVAAEFDRTRGYRT